MNCFRVLSSFDVGCSAFQKTCSFHPRVGSIRTLYYKKSNPRRMQHEIKFPEKWIMRRIVRPRFAPKGGSYSSSKLEVLKSVNLVPHKYRILSEHIPTLLPGHKVSLVKKETSKYGQYVMKRICPNVIYKSLYSRALDMLILFRTSPKVLREMDLNYGGALDEYLVTLKDTDLTCSIAQEYRDKISSIMAGKKSSLNS